MGFVQVVNESVGRSHIYTKTRFDGEAKGSQLTLMWFLYNMLEFQYLKR